MRAPVHSTKHYVQTSLSTLAAGGTVNIRLALAVEVVDKNIVSEIEEGAIVKAVYVEHWLQNDGNDASEIFVIFKDTQDLAGPSTGEMAALGTYNNKKNILFVHQGLSSNESIGNPIPVHRGWIKIPKSKQRMGLGDSINIQMSNPSAGVLTHCGFATYKEYT